MLSDKNLDKLSQLKLDHLKESIEVNPKKMTHEALTRKQKRANLNHEYNWVGKGHLVCCCICKAVFAERNFKEHYKLHLRPTESSSNSLKEIHREIEELEIYLSTFDGHQDSLARKRYELIKREYIRRKTNSGYVRIVQGGAPK